MNACAWKPPTCALVVATENGVASTCELAAPALVNSTRAPEGADMVEVKPDALDPEALPLPVEAPLVFVVEPVWLTCPAPVVWAVAGVAAIAAIASTAIIVMRIVSSPVRAD